MIAENGSNTGFSVEYIKPVAGDQTIRSIRNDVIAEQKINLNEHLEELKNGELLLEQVKNKWDIGIGREMLSENVLCKTGEELIGDSDIICELREYRSIQVCNILNWKLSQYQWGEWITCLYFKLFLNYTVPMLSKVLEQNPLIAGIYFRGEILYRILRLEDDFWKKHEEWKIYFKTLLKQLFADYSDEAINIYVGDIVYLELKNLLENF